MKIGQIAEILTMLILGYVLKSLGWRLTLTLGVLGHAARFAVFAFVPEQTPTILIFVVHGICYAFFFATVYIFADAAFPKDVRASAQGLFNLLILGVGNVAASFLFPALMARWSDPTTHAVDYRTLFLVPAGMAAVAILLLAVFFRPPQRGPAPEGAQTPEGSLAKATT
jgi:MFS family permease